MESSITTVCHGLAAQGGVPPYQKAILPDEDLADIHAYLQSIPRPSMAAPRDPQSLVALVTSPKAIGLVVRKARTAEGLSLREAAQRCGVGPRFLRELENGKPSVRLDKVLAVMAEFGLMALVLPAEALQGVKF